MLKGLITLSGKSLTLSGNEGFSQRSQPNVMSWSYRDFVQVLAICSVQVPAGRRIHYECLAFASKAILRQNMSDPAICQLCLPFPPNNSKILGKGLIIPCKIYSMVSLDPKCIFHYSDLIRNLNHSRAHSDTDSSTSPPSPLQDVAVPPGFRCASR